MKYKIRYHPVETMTKELHDVCYQGIGQAKVKPETQNGRRHNSDCLCVQTRFRSTKQFTLRKRAAVGKVRALKPRQQCPLAVQQNSA
jgi:hypothetical protein